RLVGIKPEVIHSSETNRISVLICRKRLRAPCDKIRVCGINVPRCGAIPSVSKSAIVWPTGLLDRRMKSDISDVHSGSQRYGERLDGTIEVVVIERVLIVPDACRWVGHFVAHEPDTVSSGSGLDRIAHRRASASFNGGLVSPGGHDGVENEQLRESACAVRDVRMVVLQGV